MAHPSPYPAPETDIDVASNGESAAGTPRWVKAFGIVAAAAFLLFVIIMATAGGRMGGGSSQHSGGMPPGDHSGHRPPAGLRCATPEGGR
jgi:hypothetical protein